MISTVSTDFSIVSKRELIESFIENNYSWIIVIKTFNNGFKKKYFFSDRVPIVNFSFDKALIGCGNAKIGIEGFDIPIDINDIIEILFNNILRYSGYVENCPENESDTIKIKPFKKYFDNFKYNGSFSNSTRSGIIETVINSLFSNTGISYTSRLFQTTDINTYSPEYEYETAKKILREFGEENDTYSGVNEHRIYYKKYNESNITAKLQNNYGYNNIESTIDISSVDFTRAQVWKKSGSGKERIGEVGYGGSYPSLQIEDYIIKEGDITVSETMSNDEGLDFAYELLKSKTITENVKINDIDIRIHDLKIGQKISVDEHERQQWKTIINCDTLDNWIIGGGSHLDVYTKYEGIASIKSDGSAIIYDNGEDYKRKNLLYIGFFIYSNIWSNSIKFAYGSKQTYFLKASYSQKKYSRGSYSKGIIITKENKIVNGSYSVGKYSTELYSRDSISINSYTLYLQSINSWNFFMIPITTDFQYMSWKSTIPGNPFNVDKIMFFEINKRKYEGNVIKLSYKINSTIQFFYDAEIGTERKFTTFDTIDNSRNIEDINQVQRI